MLNNRWQISLVDMCLYILKREFCPVSAGALADLGYALVVEIEDRSAYMTQIYLIETEAKMLIILQNQYNNEYKRLTGGEASPVKRIAMDYEKELRVIGKFIGHFIRSEAITTFEFCSFLNMYIEAHSKEQHQ